MRRHHTAQRVDMSSIAEAFLLLSPSYLHSGVTTADAAAAKSLQLCPTLCDPIDGSPPGSAVPGILRVRTLEWVAISFSNAWKWKVKVKSLSRAWLLVTPRTAAYQAPPPMAFSRQEYWSGLHLPSLIQTRQAFRELSFPLNSECNPLRDPDPDPSI